MTSIDSLLQLADDVRQLRESNRALEDWKLKWESHLAVLLATRGGTYDMPPLITSLDAVKELFRGDRLTFSWGACDLSLVERSGHSYLTKPVTLARLVELLKERRDEPQP